jgi:transposase
MRFDRPEAGIPVGDPCRQFRVNDATFYAWKKKYAHLGVSAAAPAARRRK